MGRIDAYGLTVAFATGNTVAVALDAGNIIHVAESLAEHDIIIAADNDAGKNGNTGILKAIEAAKRFGCRCQPWRANARAGSPQKA